MTDKQFREHHAGIVKQVETGTVTHQDPFPDDLKTMQEADVAEEEARIGRKLTAFERRRLVEDDDEV